MDYLLNTKLKNAPEWWSYDRILAKVMKELKDAENYIEPKITRKREQLKLYVNQEKEAERISDNTLYSSMQTWMATTTSDQKSVAWLGREWMDEDIAENLNNLSKFDWEEMDMPEHEIKRRWHEGMFGLSILQKKGWKKNRPVWEVRDPLAWLPDKKGWLRSRNFSYMYFDVNVPSYSLKEEDGYFNLEVTQTPSDSHITIQNDIFSVAPRLVQQGIPQSDGNEVTNIKDGYTRIDGIPYVVTLCHGVIIRFEAIKAVTKAEKEDPTEIDFPVILRFFSPLPNDPFGVSLADLVEDQQMAMTILKNLKLIQEKDLALGDTVIVSNKVKNRTDLLKAPSLTRRRFITADTDNVQNMTATIPKSQGSSDWYNFEQKLRSDVQLATGQSNVQAGVTEDTKRTASEIQASQRNANARFLLWFQIQLVADKDFWRLWYRCYQEYMSDTSEKVVRITSGLTPKVSVFNRKDITIQDPDVVLDSEENIKRINNDIRDAWMASYNFYMQDTEIPAISKNLFKRKYYQIVLRETKEWAYEKVPTSAQELYAWEDVKALNRGDKVYPDQSIDPYTMLIIGQSAEDSKEKFAYVEMCKLMIIMNQQQASVAQTSSTASQTQAQVTNNMMQQSNQPQNQTQALTL